MSSPLLLLAALVGLTVGPILVGLWPHGGAWRGLMEGLSRTLVGGLCLAMLLPHAVAEAGWGGLLAAGIGAVIPLALHRRDQPSSRLGAALALVVLSLHAGMDGAALAIGHDGAPGVGLGLAVAAHRLPVGLVVVSTAQELEAGPAGDRLGLVAIGALMAATVLGYLLAPVSPASPPLLHGALEGLVAGALLHIVLHDPGQVRGPRSWVITGGAAGVVVVVALLALSAA